MLETPRSIDWLRNRDSSDKVRKPCATVALNGDSRSLLLFGVLGAWCVVEILLINRRDGAWQKPEAPPLGTDIATAVVAVVVFVALIAFHGSEGFPDDISAVAVEFR